MPSTKYPWLGSLDRFSKGRMAMDRICVTECDVNGKKCFHFRKKDNAKRAMASPAMRSGHLKNAVRRDFVGGETDAAVGAPGPVSGFADSGAAEEPAPFNAWEPCCCASDLTGCSADIEITSPDMAKLLALNPDVRKTAPETDSSIPYL
jgi:hypothetical protein